MKTILFLSITMMTFLFCSCGKDTLLEFYNSQPKDPQIIGRWEDPNLEIIANNDGKVKGFIFESNGNFKHIHISKVFNKDKIELLINNNYLFYTKENKVHILILGDGKTKTREGSLPMSYRITENTLETWFDEDRQNSYRKYIKVKK